MPNYKNAKKSSSVNIPVEQNHNTLINNLDDASFRDLLDRFSLPHYGRGVPGSMEPEGELRESSSLVTVCAKGLLDEDAANEKKRRENFRIELERRKTGSRGAQMGALSRSPSPPIVHRQFEPFVACKPVELDDDQVPFIDGNDDDDEEGRAEMYDLSTGLKRSAFHRGNQEMSVLELDDIEQCLSLRVVENGGLESKLRSPPQHFVLDEETPLLREGECRWQSFGSVEAVDEMEIARHEHEPPLPPPQTAEFVHISGSGQEKRSAEPHVVRLVDMNSQKAPPIQIQFKGGIGGDENKTEAAKDAKDKDSNNSARNIKRNKKKRDEKNVFLSDSIEGFMGHKPIEQLVALIEGQPEPEVAELVGPNSNSKKQKNQAAGDGEEGSARKEKRRKSKEKKEKDVVLSATFPDTAATIGNQQQKAQAAAPQAPCADRALQKESAAISKSSPKRRKSAAASLPTQKSTSSESVPGAGAVTATSSADDVEEEFLSADEGVVSAFSDDTSVRTSVNSTADDVNKMSSEVMMDGANYRADDEDVTLIESQVNEEQEFITVSGKAKKKPIGFHQVMIRTGSAGKSERRVSAPVKVESNRRNSVEERGIPLVNGVKGRRPPATSLADFIDDKKAQDTRPFKPFANKSKKSKAEAERHEMFTDDAAFHDPAVEVAMASVAKNTTPSPDRAFSYADVAKKSSPQEQSRENSPATVPSARGSQQGTSPSGSVSASPSPVNAAATSSPAAGVPITTNEQLNSNGTDIPDAQQSSTGISFFYDENAAQESTPEPANSGEDDAFVLNLGNKTVRFAKGLAAPSVSNDPRYQAMLEIMATRWEQFLKGTPPKRYMPSAPLS